LNTHRRSNFPFRKLPSHTVFAIPARVASRELASSRHALQRALHEGKKVRIFFVEFESIEGCACLFLCWKRYGYIKRRSYEIIEKNNRMEWILQTSCRKCFDIVLLLIHLLKVIYSPICACAQRSPLFMIQTV
jgi:hypothetical protein